MTNDVEILKGMIQFAIGRRKVRPVEVLSIAQEIGMILGCPTDVLHRVALEVIDSWCPPPWAPYIPRGSTVG